MVNGLILASKFILYIILLIVLSIVLLFFYKYLNEFKIKDLDIKSLEKICKVVELDNKIENFDNTFKILNKELNIDKKDISVRDIGVYVRFSSFFVEEEGLFFSFHDAKINQKNSDPAFYYISGCISKYEIKG